MKHFKYLLLLPMLALSACQSDWDTVEPVTQPPQPTQPTQPTPKPVQHTPSLYELTVQAGNKKNGTLEITPLAALGSKAVSGLKFDPYSTAMIVDNRNKVMYITATFSVTNNSSTDLAVPTYIPVSLKGTLATQDGSFFRKVLNRKGQAIATIPTNMNVSSSRQVSGGQIRIDPKATPFVKGLATDKLQISVPDGSSIDRISQDGWQSARLPKGAQQRVNFAIQVPLRSSDVTDEDPFQFSLMFAVADLPTAQTITKIHAIQGSTPSGDKAAALTGTHTIEGIVTADVRSGNLKGFWVQEEDGDADNDPTTSEGIFVYCGTNCGDLGSSFVVGDKVQVTGDAGDFAVSTVTQLSVQAASVRKLATAQPLPKAVTLTLPLSYDQRERYEGMRVKVSGTVTNNYPLGRGSSFDLADKRIMNFAQTNAPDKSAFATYKASLKDRFIRIDDGSREQNPAQAFGRAGQALSARNTLRGGDTGTVTGVMHHGNDGWTRGGSIDAYRIHATQQDVQIKSSNKRVATPAAVGGTLKVGAMNVLNYFVTLRKTNSGCTKGGTNSNSSFARGAENCQEFERQQAKIVNAIAKLDADVLGLMEIENNFGLKADSAIAHLVTALNTKMGAGTYAYVDPSTHSAATQSTTQGNIGSDAIAVALIYKPSTVDLVGQFALLGDAYNTLYTESCNRPTIAQTFRQKSNQALFTAAMLHFKSKGSACKALADADQNDGQGNAYKARENAASVLADWLATNPTGVTESKHLVMGDFNAYAKEKALALFANKGYSNLFGSDSYSFQFDGAWGSLDHAFASTSLKQYVTGQTKWHINADEPAILDYNTNYKSTDQVANLYDTSAFRSSDHDPILIGLNLPAGVH